MECVDFIAEPFRCIISDALINTIKHKRKQHEKAYEDNCILNVFAYGCKIGVYITSGTANVFNLGTDNLGTGGYGIVKITGTVNVMNYMRYAGSNYLGEVTIYNLMNL